MTDSLLEPGDVELLPRSSTPSDGGAQNGKTDDDGEILTNGSQVGKLQISLPGEEEEQLQQEDQTDFVPENTEEVPEGSHSMWSAVANFINSIVGAGIIGLPYAMQEGGFGLSLLQLLLVGGLTSYSVQLIVDLGNEMHVLEYEALCSSLLGVTGFYVVSGSMIAFAYGAMVSYLIIIGDTLSPILSVDRFFVILIFGIGVCFPLSSLKDIGKLAKTSSISILGVLVLVSIVCIRGLQASTDLGIRHDFQSTWLAASFSSSSSLVKQDLVYCYSSCCANMTYFPGNSSTVPSQPQFTPHTAEPEHRNTFVTSLKNFTINTHASTSLNDPEMLKIRMGFTANKTDLSESGYLTWYTGTDKQQPKCSKVFTFDLSSRDVLGGHMAIAEVLPDGNMTNVTSGVFTQGHPEMHLSWEQRADSPFIDFNLTVVPPGNRMSHEAIGFAQKNVFQSMGVISFAYVCHHSSFLVRNSLKDKSQWRNVVYISVSTATFLSIVMSCFGYWSFAWCTRPDILNNFMDSDTVANVARVTLALTMFFTFPMELFVVRQAVTSLAFKGKHNYHYRVTALIFVVTLVPGLLLSTDQLGLVLEFTGGVAASLLGFILPGILWFSYTRWYKENPIPPASQYVEYSSPHSRPPHCSNGAGLSLSTGGLPPPRQMVDIIFSVEAVIPIMLIVIGSVSLFANTTFGFMHAAGVGTYEYPDFCPDTGTE
eukprot:TRINITY_DN12764_c0_g1_i1.p1 TRINITY_DN12764_c0_g1~~TRINITY_DN12764_c0_g1_i1.p1  ORF type:complete len:708 (+),score=92.77 TRINITY_DN12764_c0_g1_i1:69-2192(+)